MSSTTSSTTPARSERGVALTEGQLALRLKAAVPDAKQLQFSLSKGTAPRASSGWAVVRVRSAAVNPSDVKAALGLMPHVCWPRTPWRDYAGEVVDGPSEWVGREVWGSGGDLGMSIDGSHARYLRVPVASLQDKPEPLSMDEAGAVGVPFVTALTGLSRAGGLPGAGQVVLVLGANGKVGQAAVQIAARCGARVLAVQRPDGPLPGWTPPGVQVLQPHQLIKAVPEFTQGRGADVVFNTVGSPYFEQANQAMGLGAWQILIATQERAVPFDIFKFYRGQHRYVGIDTLALSSECSGEALAQLRPGFDAGELRPFGVSPQARYPLKEALSAYRRVLAGDSERIVLTP